MLKISACLEKRSKTLLSTQVIINDSHLNYVHVIKIAVADLGEGPPDLG